MKKGAAKTSSWHTKHAQKMKKRKRHNQVLTMQRAASKTAVAMIKREERQEAILREVDRQTPALRKFWWKLQWHLRRVAESFIRFF